MSSTLSSSKRERGLSLETMHRKMASSRVQRKISWVAWKLAGSLGFHLNGVSTWGTRSCLHREVRSPLMLREAPWDTSGIPAGMNEASSRVEAGTSGFLSISDINSGSLQSWNWGVRPRLVLWHETPLAS